MALKVKNGVAQPLGQFDIDDAVTGILGGEVVVFASTALSGTDKAAKDAFDGYAAPAGTASRPFLTRLGNRSTDGYSRPLMLADDGIIGYGTLFGSVVGGTAGQVVSGTALGPSSLTGSGKLTAWHAAGVYGITIDALDATVQPTTALAPGAKLYATIANNSTGGVITATQGATSQSIGNFIEFTTDGALVSTKSSLVASFNPPDGYATSPTKVFTEALIYFNPNSI